MDIFSSGELCEINTHVVWERPHPPQSGYRGTTVYINTLWDSPTFLWIPAPTDV